MIGAIFRFPLVIGVLVLILPFVMRGDVSTSLAAVANVGVGILWALGSGSRKADEGRDPGSLTLTFALPILGLIVLVYSFPDEPLVVTMVVIVLAIVVVFALLELLRRFFRAFFLLPVLLTVVACALPNRP